MVNKFFLELNKNGFFFMISSCYDIDYKTANQKRVEENSPCKQCQEVIVSQQTANLSLNTNISTHSICCMV